MASSAGARSEEKEEKKAPVDHHQVLTDKIKELERLAKESPLGHTALVHIEDTLPAKFEEHQKGSYFYIKNNGANPSAPELRFLDLKGTISPSIPARKDWTELKKVLDAAPGEDKTKRRLKPDQVKSLITKASKNSHSPIGETPPWTVATGTDITYDIKKGCPLSDAHSDLDAKLKASVGSLGQADLSPVGGKTPKLAEVVNEYSAWMKDKFKAVHDLRLTASFLDDPAKWDLQKQEIAERTAQFVQQLDVTPLKNACEAAQENLYTAIITAQPDAALTTKFNAMGAGASVEVRKHFQEDLRQAASNIPGGLADASLLTTSTAATNNYLSLNKVTADLVKNTEEVAGPKLIELAQSHAKWIKERLDNQNELLACMRAEANFSDLTFEKFIGKNLQSPAEKTEVVGVGAYEGSRIEHAGERTPHDVWKHKSGHLFQSNYDKDTKLVTFDYLRHADWSLKCYDTTTVSGARAVNAMQCVLLAERRYEEMVMNSDPNVARRMPFSFTTNYDMQLACLEAVSMANRSTGRVTANLNVGPHYLSKLPSQAELEKSFRNSYLVVGDKVYRVNEKGEEKESTKIGRAELEAALPKKFFGGLKLQSNQEKSIMVGDKVEMARSSVQDFESLFKLHQLFMEHKDKDMLNGGETLFGFQPLLRIHGGASDTWSQQFANKGLNAEELGKLNSYLSFINQHAPTKSLELKDKSATLSKLVDPNVPATLTSPTEAPAVSVANSSLVASKSILSTDPSAPLMEEKISMLSTSDANKRIAEMGIKNILGVHLEGKDLVEYKKEAPFSEKDVELAVKFLTGAADKYAHKDNADKPHFAHDVHELLGHMKDAGYEQLVKNIPGLDLIKPPIEPDKDAVSGRSGPGLH